ncbi:MAG: PAS domain S-box protein [Myxococcaceae bacterium]
MISAEERTRLMAFVVRSANDAVMITEPAPIDDPGPRILYVNEAFTRLSGYSEQEAVGRSPRFLHGPETSGEARANIRAALARREPTRVELLNYRKDGRPYWVELSIIPIHGPNGEVTHFASVQRETTSRREAEEAQQSARLRMQLALSAGAVGVWEWDIRTNTCIADERTARLYSLDPEEAARGIPLELFLGSVHPEDRPRLKSGIDEARARCTEFSAEYRVRAHDGTIRWVAARGRAECDDGRPSHFPGAVLDITEQKRATEALRHAHEGLKSLIQSSPLAMIQLDPGGRIRMWNPAAERLLGWREHEVLGKPRGYIPAEYEAEARQMLEFARRGEVLTGLETERVRRDGSRVAVSLSTAPVRDENGELGGVLVMLEDVTARREAEDTQNRLTTILEATPDVVATADADGRLLYLNRTGREMAGFRDEEVRCHSLSDLVPGWAAHIVMGEAIPTAMRDGIWRGEIALLRRDGQELPVSKVMIAHRRQSGEVEYLSTINRDISDLKRIEEIQTYLSEASRHLSGSLELEQVLAIIPELVVPRHADLCLLDLLEGEQKPELRRKVARHRDPAKQPLVDAMKEFAPHSARVMGAARTLQTGEPELTADLTESWLQEVSQDERHLALLRELEVKSSLIVPLRSRGRVIGALTCMFAESGRRYRPSDLPLAMDLADRVGLALDNAGLFRRSQDAVRTRDEVLRIVAHDLRNPLNAISLSAQRLVELLSAEKVETTSTMKHLTVILRSVERSDRLIQDLLDVARLQGGTLSLTPGPVDSASLVRQVIELQRPQAIDQQIELEGRVSGDPGRISADHDRLLQVFANLIGNAIKFTPSGGKITVHAARSDHAVCFSISDTGPGIPADHLSRIFEPFWQARAGEKKGAGLGLTISKGIVEAHGGWIWVESELGRGTTFHFCIPLASDEAQ